MAAHCCAAQTWHVRKLCRSAGFRHAMQTCEPDDHAAPKHALSYASSAVALAADQRSSRRRFCRRGDSDEKGVERRHRRRRTSQSKKHFLDRKRAILALSDKCQIGHLRVHSSPPRHMYGPGRCTCSVYVTPRRVDHSGSSYRDSLCPRVYFCHKISPESPMWCWIGGATQ